jgi:uncharacterized protein (TIGR04222 family)
MGELTENEISGFLSLLYACLVVLILIVCRSVVRQADPTAALPLPPIPEAPDPYELAYLQDGPQGVVRVALFSLLQGGYLRLTSRPSRRRHDPPVQQIEQAPSSPDRFAPGGLERRVLDWFSKPRTERVFHRSRHALVSAIGPACSPYQERLQSQGLLSAPRVRARVSRAWLIGSLAILAPGGLFLACGLAWHIGEGGPPYPFFIGFVALFLLTCLCAGPCLVRLTERGQAYLEQLQRAFAPPGWSTGMPEVVAEEALPLLIALFGPRAALPATPYEAYMALLVPLVPESSCGGCGG